MQSRFFNNIWKYLCACYLLFAFPSLHATWTSPDDLSLAGQDATKPQIATDAAGNVTAVWVRTTPGNDIIQASTKPIGGSWQVTPDDLSATGQDADEPQIAVDPDGNATAVWQRSNGANTIIQAATKLFGGSWQAVPDDLSAVGQNATIPQIAVDPDGNATVVWRNSTTSRIQASTKLFGGSWQVTPDTISPVGESTNFPQVAVDASGNVTAVWANFSTLRIQASTKLFGGSWQAVPDNISPAGAALINRPQIAVDPDGNATAVWTIITVGNDFVQASTKLFGGSWQAVPDDLSTDVSSSIFPQIAVDDNGNATAVWTEAGANNTIEASTKPFGGSWQVTPDTISGAGSIPVSAQIVVDPDGNANAIWSLDNVVQSSEQLVAPQVLSVSPNEGPPSGGTVVTLTGIGLITTTAVDFGATPALSFVVNSDSSITATAPPGALGTVNIIVTTSVGSSPASTNNQYSYVNPLPPQNLQGKQKSNRFLSQEELFNVITWSAPSSGPTIFQYKIYRTATLTDPIGTIAASAPLEFQDHNREKNIIYIYYIVSEDSSGTVSTANSIVIYP